MSCLETRELLHAFLDDELDPVRGLSVQRHLDACPDCAREHAAHRSLRASLRNEALYFRSPEGLERRVRAALGSQDGVEHRAGWLAAAESLRRIRWGWLPAVATAATLAVTAITIWRSGSLRSGPLADDLLRRDVVASHVRSLMASHLTDVLSSDQHTVKPWFNGKLDFSPPVKDLAAQEFPLAGGRLDYVGGRSVAALVFKRHNHIINLFVWPAKEADSKAIAVTPSRGYNLIHWSDAGMTFWTVSDLNEKELMEFVRDFASAAPLKER
jgi:anti-sigma factor RsiW